MATALLIEEQTGRIKQTLSCPSAENLVVQSLEAGIRLRYIALDHPAYSDNEGYWEDPVDQKLKPVQVCEWDAPEEVRAGRGFVVKLDPTPHQWSCIIKKGGNYWTHVEMSLSDPDIDLRVDVPTVLEFIPTVAAGYRAPRLQLKVI